MRACERTFVKGPTLAVLSQSGLGGLHLHGIAKIAKFDGFPLTIQGSALSPPWKLGALAGPPSTETIGVYGALWIRRRPYNRICSASGATMADSLSYPILS